MQSIQKINVDISRDRNLSEPSVYAKQNDSNSRKVEVTLFDSGVQLSSLTAPGKVFFGKGNNSYFEKIEITNGVTEFIIPQNALSSSGRIQAEILILNDTDTETLTSATFIINCHTQINPSGAINGENNGDILGQILERIEQIQTSNMSRTPLPDGAIDLNTFITSGWWYTTEQRIDITNTPKDLAELELIVTKDVLSITQILIACDGGYGICYRFSHNSGKNWTDWQKIATDADVSTATNLVNGPAEGSLRSVCSHSNSIDRYIGDWAVALGRGTRADGLASHAEGFYNCASGDNSHAEGQYNHAKGDNSHAEGSDTIANGTCQHVQGRYNIEDKSGRYAHVVGNGEDDENRSNAHTLDWNGNAWFSGDVLVGGTSQDDDNATKLSSVATDITQVKEKLDGIEEGANKTIVDSELSDTSTNPVQNKVVTEKINSANSTISSIYNRVKNQVSYLARTQIANTALLKIGTFTGDGSGGRAIITLNGKKGWEYKNDGGLKVLTLSSNSPSDVNGICTGATFYDFGGSNDDGSEILDSVQDVQILLVRPQDYAVRKVDVYIKLNSAYQYNSFFVSADWASGTTWEVDVKAITADTDPTASAMASLVVPKKIIADATKKVNLTNGTIQGAVDWNTITTTGCYKIQNCTMTADYNAPVDEYVYGVLQVLNSENETGEYRVTQIYMPRSPQRYSLWIRTNNSATGYNNWTDWIPFNNAFQLYTKFSTKADIESGTCTLSASNGTVSNATYSVVGNMVTLNFNIAPTGAGNVVVSGLPFTATKNQSGFASSTATYNITANQTSVSINSTSGTAEYCTATYLK